MPDKRQMLYQTVGYTNQSQNPNESDINYCLTKSLQVPLNTKTHFRIWLPHREESNPNLVNEFWDWVNKYLEPSTSKRTMKNCGHVAVWLMTPEDEDHFGEDAVDPPISRNFFKDGFFNGDYKLSSEEEIVSFTRQYVACHTISAIEYARSLQSRGYDVGFLSQIQHTPVPFNESFGKYFNAGPVYPLLFIYAGTEASAVKHSDQRQLIDNETVSQALVEPKWSNDYLKSTPSELIPDHCGEKLYKWNFDKSALIDLTDAEIKQLDYKKRSEKFIG